MISIVIIMYFSGDCHRFFLDTFASVGKRNIICHITESVIQFPDIRYLFIRERGLRHSDNVII